jgi:hypothetical protein
MAVAALTSLGLAQPSAPAAPVAAAAKPATLVGSEPALLEITIDPSRAAVAMDTEAGLSAEIKNVSSVPVRLFENETVFMTMPEMRIYGDAQPAIQGCATFPTQGNVRKSPRPARGHDLLLQPGDSYRVFWDMTTNGCTGERQEKTRFWSDPLSWVDGKWQKIAFTPGTYKVYLDVVLYTHEQQPYRTVTEGREIQVAASQQMILLGAFLGGLLAYLIKLYYGVETPLTVSMENRWLKELLGRTEWLSAGLFGAAMVILASRLSETFPVKVSADDFWGATTLGFVFQWMGVKLLEKLPGMGAAKNPPSASD